MGVGGSACAGRVDDVEGAEEGRQIGTSSPRGRRGRFILDSVLDWRWVRRMACTGQLRLVCVCKVWEGEWWWVGGGRKGGSECTVIARHDMCARREFVLWYRPREKQVEDVHDMLF